MTIHKPYGLIKSYFHNRLQISILTRSRCLQHWTFSRNHSWLRNEDRNKFGFLYNVLNELQVLFTMHSDIWSLLSVWFVYLDNGMDAPLIISQMLGHIIPQDHPIWNVRYCWPDHITTTPCLKRPPRKRAFANRVGHRVKKWDTMI